MAGQSFKVKIGNVWITSDGTETGRACQLELRGASDIINLIRGNTTVANSGLPFNESPVNDGGAGFPIEILIRKLETSVYNALKAILTGAAATGDDINVTATGEPGAFDVETIVFYNPIYLDFGLFIDGNVKAVVIRLITTQINAI